MSLFSFHSQNKIPDAEEVVDDNNMQDEEDMDISSDEEMPQKTGYFFVYFCKMYEKGSFIKSAHARKFKHYKTVDYKYHCGFWVIF